MAHLWFRAQHQEIAELEQQLRDTQAQLVSVERLQRCGGLDALTGLPDCSVFQTTLRREWNRARRDHVALSVLELSVSNLQAYNDRHGREAGDAVLKRVASELHSVAKRAGDSVARLLGTRFVAVLPNTSEDGATLVARRLRTKIEAAHTTSAADQPVVQVGVATMRPGSASTWDELELEALAHRALGLAEQGDNLVSLSVADSTPTTLEFPWSRPNRTGPVREAIVGGNVSES